MDVHPRQWGHLITSWLNLGMGSVWWRVGFGPSAEATTRIQMPQHSYKSSHNTNKKSHNTNKKSHNTNTKGRGGGWQRRRRLVAVDCSLQGTATQWDSGGVAVPHSGGLGSNCGKNVLLQLTFSRIIVSAKLINLGLRGRRTSYPFDK